MRYGIIGNCKTAALVRENGGIEWCCLPKFDSPSVFAAILDPGAGCFEIGPVRKGTIRQSYIPKTAILQTEFDDGENTFVLTDFMPRYREGTAYTKPPEIHRILKPLRGKPEIRVIYKPRLNYSQGNTKITCHPNVVTASNGLESIYLYSSLPLSEILAEKPIVLEKDQFLLLTYFEKFETPSSAYGNDMFEKTREYWEGWSNHCRLPSLFPEQVLRSALTLKLLTYDETGAIVAAATTSLPEILGESRNWDYRYCWLRDSSLILESLKSIGHFEEARGFIHFLLRLFESKQTKIQIVYSIEGKTDIGERILPHLKGYKNSPPVRIGNNACHTRQNDIFGEVLNTIYLYYCHYEFERLPEEVWSLVKFLVNTTAKEWATPDAGIWEFRHRRKHFTYSKILSWVAMDRGIKIAGKLGKEYAAHNWQAVADAVWKNIHDNGWMKKSGAYTQSYGSTMMDASLLLIPRYGFLENADPRWIATVHRCEEALVQNGFTFRYTNADDFGKPKNAFIVASLWMAKALYTIGEKEKALRIFEKILSHANHLGLLSESINPDTGELLGNFPQAYSHMAVINTATLLAKG